MEEKTTETPSNGEVQALRGKALAAIAIYVCAKLRQLRRPKGERRTDKVGPIEATALADAKGPGILLSIARAVTSEDPSELSLMTAAHMRAAKEAAEMEEARDAGAKPEPTRTTRTIKPRGRPVPHDPEC